MGLASLQAFFVVIVTRHLVLDVLAKRPVYWWRQRRGLTKTTDKEYVSDIFRFLKMYRGNAILQSKKCVSEIDY